MTSDFPPKAEIPADTVYILAKPGHKVSHNTRVEWFIANVNRRIVFPTSGVCALLPDWPADFAPAAWSSLSILAASPSPPLPPVFPITYCIHSHTTVKYLAHSHRITFVLDLSDSMLQPCSTGFSALHHAVFCLESVLYKLIPPASGLSLPLPNSLLTPLSLFISIIGVVPNRQSFTLIHDWEASLEGIKSVIAAVNKRLFQLETADLLAQSHLSSPASALVDMLRHGVLTLAMQMPDWAPASLVIISDACFTTLDMAELDRSLAHLRAAAIRCSFIVPSDVSTSTATNFAPAMAPRNLLSGVSANPCIPHVDLCQFIAHATAGFCLTGLSTDWQCLSKQTSSQWNQIHELLLALRLQDDAESTLEKEGDLGWVAINEIQPYSRIVHAALNHVLASRLKDGYRLRSVSVPPEKQDSASSVTSSSSWIQIELALAWKPGVLFRLFLAGEWLLPMGKLPVYSSTYYLHAVNTSSKTDSVVSGRYCIANLRVRANCSLLRALTQQRRDQVTGPYLASTLNQFDFHFRLLNHVDDYLENVSSFNLNPDIYSVPVRYKNGLCSVFITAQGASGGSEIYLSGNTAEEMEHDKSLFNFVYYWGRLLTLDIANCYRWMHSETLYVVLEHDSPLPANLFIPNPIRRVTELLTCRQSLARIHSMLSDWCTFVLLENHTYIRLEYPNNESLEDNDGLETSETTLSLASSPCVPCYFTLVRLEMKLPEVRVRVAFTAGVQSDYRRATLEQLSRRFRVLSFLPRGRQAVPKSRHKSGASAPLYPFSLSHTENVHVPPLQRTWGETPCCMVFLSQLDRLIVETGTWMSIRQQNYRTTTLPSSANFQLSKSFVRGTVAEVRCEVAPALLRQHLCTSGCIWVAPVVSKSPNCVAKMFSTLMNLRIQEGFHFVRSGPQPGFVSMAREVMFSVDSAAEGAVKQPCLIQYQLYPFRVKTPRSDQSGAVSETRIASEAVQRVLDKCLPKNVSRSFVNQLKALTSAQLSSEIQIATEVWIEPKHGHASDLPTEALYLANLSYNQVVERILQLDCFCLAAYSTLEKILTACLLRMIELQRLSAPSASPTSNGSQTIPIESSTTTTTSTSLSSTAPAVALPFNLANITAVCPRFCLLYPLLLDASLAQETTTALRHFSSDNVITRLVFNLSHRMPFITPIRLSSIDSDQFNRFLVSEETEENASRLNRALLESGAVEWQCFATIVSFIEVMSSDDGGESRSEGQGSHPLKRENFVEVGSMEISASPVTFFIIPANMNVATSAFCQDLINCLRLHLGSPNHFEPSFPIFIYSCTHTYLSFPLDDRWTYNHPDTLIVDFFRQDKGFSDVAQRNLRFACREELTSNPPDNFLAAARGNPRLTKELFLLWARLRDASLGLLDLCDEAFVECAHRTLLHDFVVSEAGMRRVLTSEQFCSALPSITVDATEFLCSTCSHCFSAVRNQISKPDSQNFTSFPCKKKRFEGCELRPNDSERIRGRLSTVLSQYFSPIPQFSGFFYFHGGEEPMRFHVNRTTTQRCDTSPTPISRPVSHLLTPLPKNSSPEYQKFAEVPANRQVAFSTSSRSESDTEEVKKERAEAAEDKKGDRTAAALLYLNEAQMMPYRKPLFLKVMLKLKHGGEEVKLPVENLPLCLFDVLPSSNEVNLQELSLSVVFTPLVWKPKVRTSPPDTSAEFPIYQESPATAASPGGHLDPVEEMNEFPNSSGSSDSEKFSALSEVGDNALGTNIIRPSLPHLRSKIHPSRRGASMSSEVFEDGDFLCSLHWCECHLEVSEAANPCSICRALGNPEFLRYLDNEQWISLRRTTQIFRWLLQDEVVCSQRLLQPLLVSTVEAVLRHMENTKSLLLNIVPSSSVLMPFHISPSYALLSKSCIRSEKGTNSDASDVLLNLMRAIGWESVDLAFIAKSEKSIPRFVDRLQSISFRYAQAQLIHVGDYYVVCRAEPSYSPLLSSSPQQEKLEQYALARSASEARIFGQIEPKSASGRFWQPGICDLSNAPGIEKVASHSLSLPLAPQPSQSNPRIEESDDSAEFESLTSKTRASSFASLEHQPNIATTTTDAETDGALFPLASQFPPQDSLELTHQKSGPSPPAFWLIFRVGSVSIQAFFHHSDTHLEPSVVDDACPHCMVFRRALDDIRSILRLVSQSLLLDQLVLDRLCDPALFPEPLEPPQRPPRHLQASASFKRKPLAASCVQCRNIAVSASSATDSDNAEVQPMIGNALRKKSLLNETTSITTDLYPPGSLACSPKFVFSLEVSPRAVVAGERGNQVLPELRRLLENFAVMNRKNMFVFDDSEPALDVAKPVIRKSLIPRIFYMLLREVPLESSPALETPRRISATNSSRRESLPPSLGSNLSSLNRIQLQATLYGISSPSRHFCNFVRTLLQSLLDKIVLECLQQVLSRTVLFRFASHDFNFLFARRGNQPRHQLFFTLPRFLTDSSKFPHVPRGALIFPFCQYLKQNLLTFMTAAKPEKEVLPSLRHRFGRSEVMLYYHRRGVGTAKFGLVTAVVDLVQVGTLEPFCITSCLDLQEWLRHREINEKAVDISNVSELVKCLADLHTSYDTASSSPDRLAVRLRLWERGDVDLKLLTEKLHAAVQNALYDLIMEYFVLSLPACLIEVPVFKSRSSDMPCEPTTKTDTHSFTYLVHADSIRMPGFFSHTLLPWLGITTFTQLPPVIEGKMLLASLESVDLLVGELVHQLNSLVEERIGRPSNWFKCPLLSTSVPLNRSGRIKSATMQQQLASTPCPCQQCINFFAFEAVDEDGEEWVKFSKQRPFRHGSGMFVQPREFIIVGKNYAMCRYETAFNWSSSGRPASSEKSNENGRSGPDEERQIPVKQVASWSGRVPIQRHQTLELQMRPLPAETPMESTTTLEDTSFDTSSTTLTNLTSIPSTTALDVPEFCEMQLCLPQFLFHPSKPSTSPVIEETVSATATTTTVTEDSDASGPYVCLQVPRQTLCLVHLRGREVHIYLYNWSRDDADRLFHRVDCLVAWYNQRFQLLSCLSLQKTGLFHCLRTPSHLRLLKQAIHLGDHLCPPELTPTSTASSAPSATMASRSIRRRLLEGLVGSGTPLQPPLQTVLPPSQITSSSAEIAMPPQPPIPSAPPSNASAGLSTHPTSPATPNTGSTIPHLVEPQTSYLQRHLKVGGGISLDSQDLNLTRIYQNCSKVPALGNPSSTGVEYLDVVHLHVDQALRTVKNDWRRAEHLRLITTPLKAWMAGDFFELEQYAPMDSQSQFFLPLPPTTTPPLTAFYSAVKRYGRTLHTVCSPILFCPSARTDALRLRELEQVAEEESYRSQSKEEEQEKDIENEEGRNPNETFVATKKSSTPLKSDMRSPPQLRTAAHRRHDLTSPLPMTHGVSRDPPSWMQEATDCLMQEFMTYMTRQMHFTVILSTLDSESPRLDHPYALLQRSVKMAGIHLVEIFIRDCIFCVRLKAIELCRLTRAASRAVLTGPLAADVVGRAAAVAAVKIASAMIDPLSFTSGGSSSSTTTANAAVSASGSSSITSSPYVVKWEESSRLCDCVHLHSFLYDFYLRNVDIFLRLQSDLIGQRLQVPSLTWALPQASKTHRRGGGGSFGTLRHPFLPASYPVVSFLRDLARIIPLAPVFARGTFILLPMCLPVDARIKPEQVFEHLIEGRQAYGFKAFDLGINSSLPTHARFGFCSFSSPRGPSTVTSDDAVQPLSVHPIGGDNNTSTSSASDSETGIVEAQKSTASTEVEMERVTPPTPQHRPCHHGYSRPPHSTSATASTARFVPQLRLPTLKHFSLACAAYLDKEVAVSSTSVEAVESSTAPRRIGISVFVILTDQCRRFPRARLSSLPHGLSAEHQTPVQWPAIRPGLSSDKDLNTLSPKLVRSGSQETAPVLTGDASSALSLSLASNQRCRHTSLNVFALGESTAGITHGGGRSTMPRTTSGEAAALQQDPGLRWKISYLGVWPSHQIELRRALKLVHQALYLTMPHIINSAILSCHKNLLWYRFFDPQYFPPVLASALPPSPPQSSAEEVDEIGQEAVSLLFSEATHRGLSCEEFQDLINSAPLKVDLLRMDSRLLDLLNICGEHLTSSVVNHLNSSGGKVVAFLFDGTIESVSGWTHLVVIDPSFREGLIHISWRRERGSSRQSHGQFSRSSWETKVEQSPSAISKFSSFLRTILAPMKQPVEGISLAEASTEVVPSWRLCDFIMRAVFRSPDSMEASIRNLSGSAIASSFGGSATATLSANAMVSNFYRTHLMSVLKLIVEILVLHVWRDLH